MDESGLKSLIEGLITLPKETEWVEFKRSYAEPHEVGEYISALSNSAALHKKTAAYLLWGIDNQTHDIVGTSFKPKQTKVKNQELESWLALSLEPRIDFKIHEFYIDSHALVLFEIQPAHYTPVRFKGTEYIRIGSYKKKLKDFPEKERAIWARLSQKPFEKTIVARDVTPDEVLALIDYPKYFDMLGRNLPSNKAGILDRLVKEKIVQRKGNVGFDVTALGATLFAKRLPAFEFLTRKAIRVINYQGINRIKTIKEQEGTKGYAVGFEGLIGYINDQLPRNEEIRQALRKEVKIFPELAIRELVANALIHQDFNIPGTGPMIEIFTDRIEITNPGIPLIDTLRFIDEPPQSRNETLAALMRRMGICEERGSGIDKVVFQAELFQLPAPEFRVMGNHTIAILFAYKELGGMEKNDRIRACYQHACLRYVSNEYMTNSSLRKRFSISDKNYPMASRIIADAVEADLIKPYDSSRKYAKYMPFWA